MPARHAPVRRPAARRAIPVALASLGLAAYWLAVPAAAQAVPANHAPAAAIGIRRSVLSERATLAYWTPARIHAARPVDLIVAGTRPAAGPTEAARPTGQRGSAPGGLPGGQSLRTAAHAAGTPAASGGAQTEAFAYPPPYDSFTVPAAVAKTYPYEVNGRLFFTNDGGDYSCSATAIPSAAGTSDENEIWTAGHCLVNTEANNQVVDSSAVFIPAYNGAGTAKQRSEESHFAPFGEFTWTGGGETASAWYGNRDLTEDEAAMVVGNSDRTGATLGDSVGWDGFAWNAPVNEQFVAFGYPAASPYNGRSLIEDIAATAGQDTISGGANATEPIGIGDPMTPGASGGAWNIGWTLTGPGYVNGHNDYYYTSQPDELYSPYQDSLSNQVRCLGASSC